MMEDNVPLTRPQSNAIHGSSVSFRPCTSPLYGLLFMLAAEMIISVAYINYFCRSFKISKSLIAIHLPLVAGLFVITTLAPGLLLYNRRIRNSRFARYVLVTVPGLSFVGLLTLYLFDFASNVWMGSNINYRLAHLYFSEWTSGHDILLLSRWVYFSFAAFAVLTLTLYLAFARTIFKGVEDLLLPGRAHSLFSPRYRGFKSYAIIGLVLLGYAGYFYALLRRAPYSEMLSSDPIVSFMRSTTEVYDENYPAFLSRLSEQEQRCRASYAPGQKFDRKNVVIIVIDALRSDHTQMYGYNLSLIHI